jgi:hypothetical protein
LSKEENSLIRASASFSIRFVYPIWLCGFADQDSLVYWKVAHKILNCQCPIHAGWPIHSVSSHEWAIAQGAIRAGGPHLTAPPHSGAIFATVSPSLIGSPGEFARWSELRWAISQQRNPRYSKSPIPLGLKRYQGRRRPLHHLQLLPPRTIPRHRILKKHLPRSLESHPQALQLEVLGYVVMPAGRAPKARTIPA